MNDDRKEAEDLADVSYEVPIDSGEVVDRARILPSHETYGSTDNRSTRQRKWIDDGVNQKSASTGKLRYPSSLDFERVINDYSIQATKDRVLVQELEADRNPPDPSETDRHALLHAPDGLLTYNSFEEPSRDDSFRPPLPPPPPPPPPVAYLKRRPKKSPLGYTGRTATRWLLTNATGLMTGLISIMIVSATDFIQTWRSHTIDYLWKNDKNHHRLTTVFILYASVNLSLALASSALCLFLAPEAAGSGIPEIKAYLNGVRVKRFTSVQLFFVKIVATILSVSSGLAIGPEGPLVHIGAILGASCTKLSSLMLRVLPKSWSTHLWSFVTMDLSHFSTDGERRDLVSIGAAAGFAAAFGAPIGGLLFTVEEASTYFDQSMFLKTLSATALATFCLAVHHGDLSHYSIISLGDFESSDSNIFVNRVEQVPLYFIVAIAGGILGGLFCRFWEFLQRSRQRLKQRRWSYELLEVAFVSLLTSSVTYFAPFMSFACRAVAPTDDIVSEKSLFDPWMSHAHQFDCPTGSVNELGTIFFGSRDDAIGTILSDPSQFDPRTLWTVGILFFPLMILTLGVNIPSGIFMPTVLIGCSLGGAAGLAFQNWISEDLSPSTFALLGAAALLAGIQRSTVSLCVILVEGTGQTKVLIPVIITVVVARYVGNLVSKHGLYETAIEINQYPFLDHEPKKRYDIFQVGEIMSTPAVTLGPRERAHTLVKLLRDSGHHGFPVTEKDTGKFLGLVRRDQIVALLECGIFEDEHEWDDDSSTGTSSMPGTPSTEWTPKPGIGKSSLMHLAFHIPDDRYDYLTDNQGAIEAVENINKMMVEDEFDANAWLVSIRRSREHLAGLENNEEDSACPHIVVGDDTLPPISQNRRYIPKGTLGSTRAAVSQGRFATVTTNSKGDVYVQWLNPSCKRKWVHVAAVMNRGTYCVTETTPLSNAHFLFTSLGLRHLVVLGGKRGGTVVGVVTRINLLKDFIQERTGCKFY
jgi:chloride channel 7